MTEKSIQSVLIHGSLGRDRTGMVVALLLGMLGVRDNDILKEYDISHLYEFSAGYYFNIFKNFMNAIKGSNSSFAIGADAYLTSCWSVSVEGIDSNYTDVKNTIKTVLIG